MSTAATLERALPLKFWATCVARAALQGYQLWRTDPDDGQQRYFIGRFGIVRAFGDLDAVAAWLDDVDGQPSVSMRSQG